MNRTRLTDSERVAMQSVETFLRETFLRCLYVVARSAERDAVRLGVVAHRTHRLTTHGPNHIVHIQTITRTPPVQAHRPIVTYLQLPIQVCFSILSVCRPRPSVTDNFRHRQPYGLNSSIDRLSDCLLFDIHLDYRHKC